MTNSSHVNAISSSGHGTITSMLGLASPTRREPHLHARRRTKIALHNRFVSRPRGRHTGRHATSVGATNYSGSALFGLQSRTLVDGSEEVSLLPSASDVPAEISFRPSSPQAVSDPKESSQEKLPPSVNGNMVRAVSNSNGVHSIEADGRGSLADNLARSWSELSAGRHGQIITFPNSERQGRASLRHSVHSFPSSVDVWWFRCQPALPSSLYSYQSLIADAGPNPVLI